MTDKHTGFRRIASLPTYLVELSVLVGRKVDVNELLPENETSILAARLKQIPKHQVNYFRVPFDIRQSAVFAAMIEELHALNPSAVVLWPTKANDCGLLEIPSLKYINFDFGFDAISEGILVVSTRDGLDRMLLDFGEEEGGERLLDIELHGPNWSRAKLIMHQPTIG